MATISQSSDPTQTGLPDRELEHHLAALRLASVEDYVQWCAAHGFSTRIEKGWHQRCKERYFALRRQIEDRAARKKRESRKPETILLEIESGELTASDLNRPELVAISEAFSTLGGDARKAFLNLVVHAQAHANLLQTGNVIPQFGAQPGNTYIQALLAIARNFEFWLRPVESWRPSTRNTRRQFSSLARHLLAKYPMPPFMDCVWFLGDCPPQQTWFRLMATGTSPRELDLPVRLTKGMVRHFLATPDRYSVAAACRRAQVFGLGGSSRLADLILGSRLGDDFCDDEFCCTLIRWLIANPTLKPAQVGPIIDFHYHRKAATRAADETTNAEFSIKGCTAESTLQQMHQWHTELRKESARLDVTWYECGIEEFDFSEGMRGDVRRWTIREIVARNDLRDEGRDLRHCVAWYEPLCIAGKCAIWSLGVERNGGARKRTLTIEIALARKAIRQVKGKANRLPNEKEMEIVHRWAEQERLAIDGAVNSR